METLYHIDGVHTSQAVAGWSFDHVLVGYGLADVLARRRDRSCSYILAQTEYIAVVDIGISWHGLGDL